MRHGIVLFTSDRGITPAQAAKAAEERGFDTFYVPEHTHIPVRREAAHPRTGDETPPGITPVARSKSACECDEVTAPPRRQLRGRGRS